MPEGTPFGPNITATVAYLHGRHMVSYERLTEVCEDMLGLDISEGAIANMLARTGKSFETKAERIAEALVFASAQPVSEAYIESRLPRGADVRRIMGRLKALYATRGVNLVQVADHWAFRTAADLSFVVQTDEQEVRKLSRAALEVLAIIAYHQPVTRAEIEDIRGVQTSKGTLFSTSSMRMSVMG